MSSNSIGHGGAAVGRLFARFAKCVAVAQGDLEGARHYACAQPWSSAQALDSQFKGLMTPTGVGAYSGSQGPVFRDLATYVRPRTIVGKLEALRAIPFATRVVRGVGGTRASWVVAGEPVPVAYGSFEIEDALDIRKVSTIAILTSELVKNSSPKSEMVMAADIGGALAQSMDEAFVDPASGATAARPASITYGATTHESSGSTPAAIDADLAAMIKDLVTAGNTLESAVWILSPITAASLSLMRDSSGALAYPKISVLGGELAGLPAITSTACAASGSPGEYFVVLLESGQVDLADDDSGQLELARHAAVQMDDAPAASAQSVVSLWQNGLVGFMSTRYLNWRARRAGIASVLRSVTY